MAKEEKVNTGPVRIDVKQARPVAKEAYIWGFPLVDNYRIQYSYFVDQNDPEYKTGWNQIYNNARVYTSEDKTIQTPNSDTPYSYIGADLRGEPLVLGVPAVDEGRYYSIQFIDMYTFNFAYIGSRTTGNGAAHYLLAGPDWHGKTPDGVAGIIRSETQLAFVLYRTQLFNPGDIEHVKAIQAGFTVQSLSSFQHKKAPPDPPPPIDFIKPLSATEERVSPEFFRILNFILAFCPLHPDEKELMKRFSKLGIGPGLTFNPGSFDAVNRQAIQDGIADAWLVEEGIRVLLAEGKINAGDLVGTRKYLKNNYAYRMTAAAVGIYGNSREEAMYPLYYQDSAGQALDTSKHNYTIRFEKDQLPPVNAFWSLTLYELPASLLFANSLNRYLINSPMLPGLKKDEDGGLTLYIQNKTPGKEKEANWLPAPKGPVILALRLYWPKEEAFDGTWKAPAMKRLK